MHYKILKLSYFLTVINEMKMKVDAVLLLNCIINESDK